MNTIKPLFSILFLMSILFLSCPKPAINPCDPDDSNNLPEVSIVSVMVMGNMIVVKGQITSIGNDLQEGVTEHGVVWSNNLSPTINDDVFDKGSASSTGPFTAELTGFSTGTINFRTYVRNCAGIVYSSDLISVEYTSGVLEVVSAALAQDSNNNGIVNSGENIAYNFAVLNSGDVDATNVEIQLDSDYPQYIDNFSPSVINIAAVNAQSTSSLQNFSFQLSENTPEGEYCVKLNISANNEEIENISSICFSVQTIIEAEFSIINNGCMAPCSLTFDASLSSGGSGLSYIWDFGDGSNNFITNDIEATHLYQKSGDYLVRLQIEGLGGIDTISKVLTINAITFRKKLVIGSTILPGYGIKVNQINNGYDIFANAFYSFTASTVLIKANHYGDIDPTEQILYNDGLFLAQEINVINDSTFFSTSCSSEIGDDIASINIFDNQGNITQQRTWTNSVCGSIGLVVRSNGNLFLTGIRGGTFQGNGPIFLAELDNSSLETIENLPLLGNDFNPFSLKSAITDDDRIFIALEDKLYLLNNSEGTFNLSLIPFATIPFNIDIFTSDMYITPNDKIIIINNYDFRVLMLDLNGTILFDTGLISPDIIVSDSFVDEENSLIITGKENNNCVIAKYSLNNFTTPIWKENYPFFEGSSRGNSINQTTDGGYIITGEIGDLAAGLLIKTDHLGQVEE